MEMDAGDGCMTMWKHLNKKPSWSCRENFQSFTTEYVISYGFFMYGFYHSEFPSVSCSLSVFIVQRCGILSCFYCINWDDLGFFSFILWRWHITLIFCLSTHSQIPGINPTWSLEYNPFNIILWFAHILLRILMSIFIKDICNFLVVSLPGFGISVKVCKIYSRCKTKSYNP